MTSESQLVIDIWEAVRDSLPNSKRSDAAIKILKAMEEYGFESSELASIVDEDNDLAEAFGVVFDDDDDNYDSEEDEY